MVKLRKREKMHAPTEKKETQKLIRDGQDFDFFIIPKSLFREKGVGVKTLAILGYLIENNGTKDGCTATAQRISHDLDCSLATVFVSLNKLRELGILEEESEVHETYKRFRKISGRFHKYRKILDRIKKQK